MPDDAPVITIVGDLISFKFLFLKDFAFTTHTIKRFITIITPVIRIRYSRSEKVHFYYIRSGSLQKYLSSAIEGYM